MKALVTGAGGQLGRELLARVPKGAEAIGLNSAELDIGDDAAVAALVLKLKPTIVFNAAAYTAVDRAEDEAGRAQRVNADGVANLAAAARAIGARLVQVSSDFVFDGRSGTPYSPDAATNPLSNYGRTKLAGEKAAGDDALIVRTSWVYGVHGVNFVRTMLDLMSEREELGVVSDQIGSPTWAGGLADALWSLARKNAYGVYHYSDSGVASWYDLAVAIREEAAAIGLLDYATAAVVKPIMTSNYPTPAARPSYSVLEKSGTWAALGAPAPHWRTNLRVMLEELKNNG